MNFETVTVKQIRTVMIGSHGTRSVIFETVGGARIELSTGVKSCKLSENTKVHLYDDLKIYAGACLGCAATSCQLRARPRSNTT